MLVWVTQTPSLSAQHAPSASQDAAHHSADVWSQSGCFTSHALICKDNETNKHEPAVYPLLVLSDNQNTEAIAMPNWWLDKAVALLVYFKAMQPKQNECACFTHCFWMLFEGHSSFQWRFDSSGRMGRSWMQRRWKDDNMTCNGTEGVDSRPNTSPYWCTKCCDTRHQQDGLSFSPRLATQPKLFISTKTRTGPEPSGSGYWVADTSKLTSRLWCHCLKLGACAKLTAW